MHKSLIDDIEFAKMFKRCILLAPLLILSGAGGIGVGLVYSYVVVVIVGIGFLLIGLWMVRFVLLTWTRRRMMGQLHGGVGSVIKEQKDALINDDSGIHI